MSTTHELKLWTDFFEDMYRKPFELRFRGIDKERQDAALVRLVDATEKVKDFDGGNYDAN